MKLKLLNIEEFIKTHNVKPVTSTNTYSGGGNKLDPNGLFSEQIFGRLGSKDRKKTFGYIDLKTNFIHPEVYKLVLSVNPLFDQLINKKVFCKFNTKEKTFVKSEEEGETGFSFFIKHLDRIDFTKNCKDNKLQVAKFLNDNKNKILISKILVLPAGIRDIIQTESGKTIIQYSEITQLYEQLLRKLTLLPDDDSLFDELVEDVLISIQKMLGEINSWIKNNLKGKQGLIRGGLLGKVIDYSARVVCNTDNKIPLGYVGLGYQICLKLFELFAIHHILKKDNQLKEMIKAFLKIDDDIGVNDLKNFFTKLAEDPSILEKDKELENSLFELAKEITKDKVVLWKRDPVETKESYEASNIVVERNSTCATINPLSFSIKGLDNDGDTVAIIALLTNEAQNQAKKRMHIKYSKTMWANVSQISGCNFPITLTAATAIYRATRQ